MLNHAWKTIFKLLNVGRHHFQMYSLSKHHQTCRLFLIKLFKHIPKCQETWLAGLCSMQLLKDYKHHHEKTSVCVVPLHKTQTIWSDFARLWSLKHACCCRRWQETQLFFFYISVKMFLNENISDKNMLWNLETITSVFSWMLTLQRSGKTSLNNPTQPPL